MKVRELIKGLTPPLLRQWLGSFRYYRGRIIAEWEYVPEGWRAAENGTAIKGWNVDSVLAAYRARWPEFVRQIEAQLPFGLPDAAQKATQGELAAHNTQASYAYALSLAARCKKRISMLDWGGGIGHYYLLSRAILNDVEIDYHCKDVPVLAEHGRTLFPQASFYTDDSCLRRRFDFVLASGSLHYAEDWRATVVDLARATDDYLFVTRLPVAHHAPSYVFVQRAYRQGYGTEFLSWCINRGALLECAQAEEMELVREFVIGEQPQIYRAPEPCEYRGFLFRCAAKAHENDT